MAEENAKPEGEGEPKIDANINIHSHGIGEVRHVHHWELGINLTVILLVVIFGCVFLFLTLGPRIIALFQQGR